MPQEFSRLARLFTAMAALAVLAACGGGGGGGGPTPGNPGNPGGATVTVSGKITFDRLPFRSALNGGLDAANPVESPAREVFVEAVAGGSAAASTYTDANGDYSLSVPANTSMFIRARAQMVKSGAAPTWDFAVLNNRNSDAVYALQGSTFTTGTANETRNLRAPSGWGGSSYTGERAAAPFAILDTIYRSKQLILSAAPTANFSGLKLYWSVDNRDSEAFCPDQANIVTSSYVSAPDTNSRDDCDAPLAGGIYVLGNFVSNSSGDTDEFDQHVIAHEFGHYFEDQFSRSDSIGGQHSLGDLLDMRVAFGEGWGNAFAAMALNDPVYRDSSGGISQDGGFNLETGNTLNEGWFSESSVGEFLWDVFDNVADVGDSVALGFGPILAVMTAEQVDTPALTSIFSFADALLASNGGSAGAIRTVLTREEMVVNDAFGSAESNDGNDPGFTGVYTNITTMVADICSTNGSRFANRLGNRRFLRYVKNAAGPVNIVVTGNASATVPGSGRAQDPDVVVHQQGAIRAIGQSEEEFREEVSVQLAAGVAVIEVYAFETINSDTSVPLVTTPRCMSVSITSN